MATRFHHCLQIVLGNEGGYVNHKNDRGGATNFGVTQRVYNDYRLLLGKDQRPVREIEQPEVEAIYFGYWKTCNAGVCPEPLDLFMFDTAINSGAKRAIKLLQIALGIDDDGIWGNQTARALAEEISAGNITPLCMSFLDAREDFFNRIVENDAKQAVFLKGWLNRLDHLREYV